MFTLIALGVGVAFGYSVMAMLFPEIFPEALKNHGGFPAVYFEAAAVITTLVLLGQVLELEREWRELYSFAWADFHRFLKGWSPGHWKINSYSERLVRETIQKL